MEQIDWNKDREQQKAELLTEIELTKQRLEELWLTYKKLLMGEVEDGQT
jgi:hypothetical protein